MSAPAFRSRWADWNPGTPPSFPGELSETEPAKPAKPGFEGFEGSTPGSVPGNHPFSRTLEVGGCTSCGSSLSGPGDVLCGPCYVSIRGSGVVLTFDPRRRLRTISRLTGRPCGDCGAIDWNVNARGDATCRTCARGRGAAKETGTDTVPGDAA